MSLSNLSRSKLEALAVLKQRGVDVTSLVQTTNDLKNKPTWKPNPGPQTLAFDSEADELFYGGAGGGGKALPIYAIIPTAYGYCRMENLNIGDEVFGMDGKVYPITAVSEVMYGHRVFDVVFDDGSVIRADGDHKWHTFTYAERMQLHRKTEGYRERRRLSRLSRGTGKRPDLAEANTLRAASYIHTPVTGGVRTTLEIKDTLYAPGPKKQTINHAVAVAEPLNPPEKKLLVEPYVLGYWLGDGSVKYGRLTIGSEYIEEAQSIFARLGYALRGQSQKYAYTLLTLQPKLRKLGVLGNKHIPEQYLFGSKEQRIELLQGLMDTDGYATKDGQCEFYSSSKVLIEDMSKLLHTLGIKHAIKTKKPPKDTLHSESYRIKFVAPFLVFKFTAKASRQNLNLRATQKWRYIVEVREVDTEPVKCIAVASPDHLYLAGNECIPTHNTDLLLGCAALNHHRSIIFRRVFPSMRGIIERSREIYNAGDVAHQKDSYNETLHIWRLATGKVIEFGALQYEKDKENYRGRPHDLYAWDEITEFSESQFRFVNGWNRSTTPGQRCRIIATGNPPSTDDGLWIIKYWGPWLDPDHPNPAVPGELRWFAVLGGKDIECDGPEPVEHEGEIIHPRSRTFIPARLSDNPFLRDSGYLTVLQGLPEPLRSQMLYGDFSLSMGADPWQVIPGAWVRAAQARWTANGGDNLSLSAIGVDVARGGRDKTVISMRRGNWFAPLLRYPGTDTPSGQSVAGLVLGHVETGCIINVDVIGVGSSVYDTLSGMYKGRVNGVNVAERSDETDKSGKLNFINKRAEGLWKLREALDPETGDNLALPPDAELLADLTSAKWTLRVNGIQIESKQDIKKRIGRSPDAGDAFVLAFWTNYSVITEFDDNIRDLLMNYKGY